MSTTLRPLSRVLPGLLLLAACGGTASTTNPDPPSASDGRLPAMPVERAMTMSGVRCQGATCACRELDNFGNAIDTRKEEGVPAGKKRFELRIGRTTDDVKLTIAGHGTFEKPGAAEPEAACGYVDLPNGKHRVRYRVEALRPEGGIAPLLQIKEWGQQAESWYDSLAFRCSTQGPCRDVDVADWIKQLRTVERGIHDRCGSVRVQEIRFAGTHAPDHTLTALEVELTLNVYDFAPTRPHGADCSKRSPKEQDDAGSAKEHAR